MNASPPPTGPNSIMVQPCQRCGARWQVRDTPAYWCPKCDGVLGAPIAVTAPPPARPGPRSAPQAPTPRRGYRWTARPPAPIQPYRETPPGSTRPPASRPLGPTPRYRVMPRWGLPEYEPEATVSDDALLAVAASRAVALVTWTGLAFLLAAAAELWRYVILLRSRGELIGPAELWLSDQILTVFAIVAPMLALAAAYTCVDWLLRARRAVFANAGVADTRTYRWTLVWCLVPVVNLVMPGVLLTELADRMSPRLRRVVRIWWLGWVASGVLSVVALLWHTADTVQAQANGVLVSALTDAMAVAMAVLTLWLIRETEGRDLLGRPHVPKRAVLAFGPARAVIEPIGPRSGAARAARVGKDAGDDSSDDDGDTDGPAAAGAGAAGAAREDEEVLTT